MTIENLIIYFSKFIYIFIILVAIGIIYVLYKLVKPHLSTIQNISSTYQPDLSENISTDTKINNARLMIEEIHEIEKIEYPKMITEAKNKSIFLSIFIQISMKLHFFITLSGVFVLFAGFKMMSNFPLFVFSILVYLFFSVLRDVSYNSTPLLKDYILRRKDIQQKYGINTKGISFNKVKYYVFGIFLILLLILLFKNLN